MTNGPVQVKGNLTVVDGNHAPMQGVMTMLQAYLNNSMASLRNLDAINHQGLYISSLMQNNTNAEDAEIARLSGDAPSPDIDAWMAAGHDPSSPDAPGLQWLLANKPGGDDAPLIIQGMQAYISDEQMRFSNIGSMDQQKTDLTSDTGKSIETETNNTQTSMTSGLMSILQSSSQNRV